MQCCFLNKRKRGIVKRRFRPFQELTGVENRSYSKRCQKLVTDFGVEESFQQAMNRMKEHHGIEIPVSSVRRITEKHAGKAEKLVTEYPQKENISKQMIIGMDGEMIPLVEYKESDDRRKTKQNFWSELRIGVVQNEMLEEGKCKTVFRILKRELRKHPNHEGLQTCIKYIENRPGQFDYKAAIEKDLPIGSGKVESTHRTLMQKRLKKPGTWWLRENAEKIANLRTLRANGGWDLLWQAEFSETELKTAA